MKLLKLLKRRGLLGTFKIGLNFLITSAFSFPPFSYLSEYTKRKIRVFLTIYYWPDFKQPKTFNELLSNEFLFGKKTKIVKVYDKYEVRNYLKTKNLANYLTKIYKIFHASQEINFSDLPEKFVVKSNYGGSNKHVRIINNFNSYSADDIEGLKHLCKKWLSVDEVKRQMDDNYFISDITPTIIIEEFLEDKNYTIPLDYKYYIIKQEIAFIEVVQGRFKTGSYVAIYDKSWEKINFTHGNPLGQDIAKPQNLEEMNDLAKKLSEDFDFSRIDLYNIDQKRIVFGEITPLPGTLPFKPRKFDKYFGTMWLNK